MKVLVSAQEPDTNASTCCSTAAIRATAARRTMPRAKRGDLRNEPPLIWTLRRAITTSQAPSEAYVKKGFEPMLPGIGIPPTLIMCHPFVRIRGSGRIALAHWLLEWACGLNNPFHLPVAYGCPIKPIKPNWFRFLKADFKLWHKSCPHRKWPTLPKLPPGLLWGSRVFGQTQTLYTSQCSHVSYSLTTCLQVAFRLQPTWISTPMPSTSKSIFAQESLRPITAGMLNETVAAQ